MWVDCEIQELIERHKNALDDFNLFEKALWDAKKVCVVPGRPMRFEEESIELLSDDCEYRLRMMEDMIEYYQRHHVNDDDLDTIQTVMQGGYEQLTSKSYSFPDRSHCGESCDLRHRAQCGFCEVYFGAVDILALHHVLFDETTGAVTKSLEEIGDACLRYDIGRRAWGQIGIGASDYEHIADSVEDKRARPDETCEERLLKERLREVLNTLTDSERRVIDFRFGLSDGDVRTLEEVGRLFCVTRERIRQVETCALRKLRHPVRMHCIGEYRTLHPLTTDCEVGEDEVVLESLGGVKYSLVDLVYETHLPEHEIRRRLKENWSAERILSERVRPTKTQLCQAMGIGDLRFEIGVWLEVLGIQIEDLYPFVNWNGLNTVWSKDNLWEAVLKCLKERLCAENRDYDAYLALLGVGWSRTQIELGAFRELPQYYKSVVVCVDNARMRMAIWQRRCNVTESELIACLRDEDGTVRWDADKIAAMLRARIAEKKRLVADMCMIKWRGACRSRREWAEVTGIPEVVIKERLDRRWHIDDVFMIPYPCRKIITQEGRRYTEKMYLERFGISYKEHLRRKHAEEEHEKWQRLFRLRLAMAGICHTIAEWLQVFEVEEDEMISRCKAIAFGKLDDASFRRILRSLSRISSNQQVLQMEARWRVSKNVQVNCSKVADPEFANCGSNVKGGVR